MEVRGGADEAEWRTSSVDRRGRPRRLEGEKHCTRAHQYLLALRRDVPHEPDPIPNNAATTSSWPPSQEVRLRWVGLYDQSVSCDGCADLFVQSPFHLLGKIRSLDFWRGGNCRR